MFFYGVTKHDFDTRWKGFQVVKKSLENKLTKKKQHIRALMIDRLVLQHEVKYSFLVLPNIINVFICISDAFNEQID